MLRDASALTDGHLQGAHKIFSMCTAYDSTSIVRILHMIEIIIIIIIIIIKCYNS